MCTDGTAGPRCGISACEAGKTFDQNSRFLLMLGVKISPMGLTVIILTFVSEKNTRHSHRNPSGHSVPAKNDVRESTSLRWKSSVESDFFCSLTVPRFFDSGAEPGRKFPPHFLGRHRKSLRDDEAFPCARQRRTISLRLPVGVSSAEG